MVLATIIYDVIQHGIAANSRQRDAARVSPRRRRAAGPARLRPYSVFVSAVALFQSCARQYFARRFGIRAPVPYGVLAEPDWNAAALSRDLRPRLTRLVGALSAPLLSLEDNRDRPAHAWAFDPGHAVQPPDRRAPGPVAVWTTSYLRAGAVQFLGGATRFRRVAGRAGAGGVDLRLHRSLFLASPEAIFSGAGSIPARDRGASAGPRVARVLSAGQKRADAGARAKLARAEYRPGFRPARLPNARALCA